MVKRTWQDVLDEIIKTKTGETRYRWSTVAKDKLSLLCYARKALVTLPPLEEYERRYRHKKIIPVDFKDDSSVLIAPL